ncbi:unnamed protein product [Parajaminaea phylloscopi]
MPAPGTDSGSESQRLRAAAGHYATPSSSSATPLQSLPQWAAGQQQLQPAQLSRTPSSNSTTGYATPLDHRQQQQQQHRGLSNGSLAAMNPNAPHLTSATTTPARSHLPASASAAQHRLANSSPASGSVATDSSPGSVKRRKVSRDRELEEEDPLERDGAAASQQPQMEGATSSELTAHGAGSRGNADGQDGAADESLNSAAGSHRGDGVKRIKTARACDSCRRKKIRCDVIDDGSPPPGDPNNGNGGLTCAHCRQYGFNCTFFLPITETRFKKKREREAEEAARDASLHGYGLGHVDPLTGLAPHGPGGILSTFGPGAIPSNISAAQEWPAAAHVPASAIRQSHDRWAVGAIGMSPKTRSDRAAPGNDEGPQNGEVDQGPPPDMRVMGPTSLAYIVHSTAFVPGSAIEAHDLKHSQTFEVGASGDGIIKLNRPRHRKSSTSSSGDDEDAMPHIPDAIRGRLAGDVAEKLINSYFENIGYLFPVVTKSEFLHLSTPPALLFYAICGVAALDRNVPREVLSAVRIGLNAIFRDIDLLSVSSAITVKALLILSLHGDIHGSTNVQSGSRMWNRLGVGLRMAQDLGLHRDASGRDDVDAFAHYLEQKRRVWGACVTADRLVSIVSGHPLAVDLTDCDVRLPSPYEVTRFPTDLPSLPGEDRPFAFNTEMLKLAILFGRVQKTIYSPTGLMKATDEEITGLLSDIDQWRDSLPQELIYTGSDCSPAAGILHLAFSCIQMLFFRVFMRISYSCPQHLKFSLTIERMTSLIRWSRDSIDWVDKSGALYLDTMQFVSYALVFCATVQYHCWIRRGDESGLRSLAQLQDVVKRGRTTDLKRPDLTLRAKTAEIISLLHESASGQWANTPFTGNLNPTAGVVNRRTADSVRGIIWRNAPGRPGGGAYEASEPHLLLSDLPPGTIILGTDRTPALVRSANGWSQVPGALQEHTGMSETNGPADKAGSLLPDLSNFTHLGGNVWQDENGWPVDQRGSGLMVMLPQNGSTSGNASQQGVFDYLNSGMPAGAMVAGGPNVNPHLNGVDFTGADRLPNGTHSNVGQNGAMQSSTTRDERPIAPDSVLAALGADTSQGANASVGGSAMGNTGLGPINTAAADPLMLNDPLMGMLDWQAWQSYLAPFSNAQSDQGDASLPNGPHAMLNPSTDSKRGGHGDSSSPRHPHPRSQPAGVVSSYV